MSRTFLAVPLPVMWLLARSVLADGGFVPPKDYSGEDLREPCQRAILVHREKKESLILLVDYEGGAKEFAWLVPTPTKPEVRVAEKSMFEEIARYYHSRQVAAYREEMRERARQSNGLMGGVGGVGPTEERVMVYAQKLVGPYETAVLSANGEHALLDWLSAHGFQVGEGAAPILAQYIKENWYFVTAKVYTSASTRQSLPPLRLDFAAGKPVYPLRISSMNRGITEIRLYLLQGMAVPPEFKERSLSRSFRVHADFASICPRTVKAFPGFADGNAILSRVVDQFPSQVLARTDDRLDIGKGAHGEPRVAFLSYCCVAKTVGIAEALLSADAEESKWGEDHLYYYGHIVRGARGGDLPKEQLEALRALPQEKREALKKRLLAFLGGKGTPGARGRTSGSNREGAMVLLARIVRPDDAEVIAYLETLGKMERGPQTSTDQLLYLGSPASRRALFRAACAGVNLSGGSAFRYVYSLEDNQIGEKERRLACGELLHLLSEHIAVGGAKKRALKLLKAYTGQNFGTYLIGWELWLKEHRPDYWQQKEP